MDPSPTPSRLTPPVTAFETRPLNIPHAKERIWALLLFVALTVLFHGWQDLLHRMAGDGDAYIATIASLLFTAQLSPWNPYVQLGQYAFANIHYQSFYPPNLIILSLLPNTLGYNLFILLHYVAAGYFFFIFARLFMARYPALFGAVVFMLGGFIGAHKGHASMLSAAVWLPLILYFVERYNVTRRMRDVAGAGLAFGACILAGFPQITLYTSIVTVCYLGFRFFGPRWTGDRSVKRFGFAAGLLFSVGVLVGSIQLMPLIQAFPLITREKLTFELFSQNNLPLPQVLTLFMPNLMGGLFSIRTYSPSFSFVEVYPYSGLLPLAFAFVAFAAYRREKREVVFWTAIGLTALVVALGSQTPLYALLFHVPIYNLFRASARHLFEVDFALAVLAGLGLDFFVSRAGPVSRTHWRRVRRALIWFGAGFIGTLCLATAARLGAQLLTYIDPAKLDAVHINPFQTLRSAGALVVKNLDGSSPAVYLPCLFFTLVIVVFALLRTRYRAVALALVLPVSVGDLYLNYRTMYSRPDTRDLFDEKARPEMVFLNRQGFDRKSYRTFPVDTTISQAYPLLNMMYGVSTINDYTPFWMKRYHALTDFEFNGWMPAYRLQGGNLLSIAGAKYVMATDRDVQQGIEAARAPVSADSRLTPIRLPELGSGGWQASGDVSFKGATAHLNSPSAEGVGLIQTEFPIKANTNYIVRFEARTTAPRALLVVDFYGAKYDLPAQDRAIPNLFSEFRQYELSIPAGEVVPAHAALRLYTVGQNPVEIRGPYLAVGDASPPAYQPVFTTSEGMKIYQNPNALPRFRFVSHIKPGGTFEEVRAAVEDPRLDVRNTAIVEGVNSEMNVDPGRIVRDRIANNDLEWVMETGRKSFFIVGDTYFPGWKAYVDGREVPIYAVDGIVRGIFVDGAGQHQVSMHFRPWSLYAGIGSSSLGLCLALFVYWRDRRSASRNLLT